MQPFIHVSDEFPPEATAMLQALYSRDPKSVLQHKERVQTLGVDKFMSSYYVGYGHKSIGDCGTTTVFIEQVSMLAAKSFQDWPLYNGQEASTRYLDMSAQEMLNPCKTTEGESIQNDWRSLYRDIQSALVLSLMEIFPRMDDQVESVYRKSIQAKAFDIARGFLPAGTTTLLSWHTNLRQAYDHLQQLHYHPLGEVREVTALVHTELQRSYPQSFSHKYYAENERYIQLGVEDLAYFHDPACSQYSCESFLRIERVRSYDSLLRNRPAKSELHQQMRSCGDVHFSFPLDFGSFRDLQRHRSATIAFPRLTLDIGFHPWYESMLPPDYSAEFMQRFRSIIERVSQLECSEDIRQYYIPMGYLCSIDMYASLPSAVYIAELRSAQTVHPTLRKVAQQMLESLQFLVPSMQLHGDMSSDEWSIKRGTHDIVEKQQQ